MVADAWILKVGNQVSANLKHALLLETSKKPNRKNEPKKPIGILSFEVAIVMSKLVTLHKSLVDNQVHKLKNEILNCSGIKALISNDKAYLMDIVMAEKLYELGRVAGVVARLGKKCSEPALQGFEHVYGDIVGGVIEVKKLGFLVKDMEGMVKKMERFVNLTAKLYGELEVLSELERGIKKFKENLPVECVKAFEQKLVWQMDDVKHLKDVSLWNQTYDKVVELLARTVCTVYVRICHVFGGLIVREEVNSGFVSGPHVQLNGSLSHFKEDWGGKPGQIDVESGGCKSIRGDLSMKNGNNKILTEKKEVHTRPQLTSKHGNVTLFREGDFSFACGMGPGRLLMECLSSLSSTSASKVDDGGYYIGHVDRSSQLSGCCSVASSQSGSLTRSRIGSSFKCSVSTSSRRHNSSLISYAPPSTVGGSGLALHYANIIIVVEKLLQYPHLVGEEARDDLYYMLPTSIKKRLKTSLKSCTKDLAIYDASVAHDWKERIAQILDWLLPLAQNMIRWQSERNVEQQQLVKRTNVLLLQTLYFADMGKMEVVLCELLVGLNYICRYEHQVNALFDCESSFDFDDWGDWQMQW